MKNKLIVIAPVIALLWLVAQMASGVGAGKDVGVERPLPIGARVVVQFKRDILGVSGEYVIEPTRDIMGSNLVSMEGKILSYVDGLVCLEHGKGTAWIPMNNILLIDDRVR